MVMRDEKGEIERMKIIRIDSARHMDGSYWMVGEKIKRGLLVTEIKDSTLEYEDSVYSQFDIYVNGNLYKTLINMPVQVEYEVKVKGIDIDGSLES